MEIDRIRGVISRMKLQEKIAFTGGDEVTAAAERMNIPAIVLCNDLRPYSAVEPSVLAIGCTFSHTIASAFGKERSIAATETFSAFAGTVACGLITDPMRLDACGFFSEDPYLTGELLKSYAAAGVIGYVFTDALGQGRYVNRTVDARALYELYLYPLIEAGKYAAGLMLDGGYLNGQKAATSRAVADIYSEYIPSNAMIMTCYGDGCGTDGIAESGAYQLGAEGYDKKEIAKAVASGEISETKIDRAIERTLFTVGKTYEFYRNPHIGHCDPVNIVFDSTVLLKNDGILPTDAKSINFFGDANCFDDADIYGVSPIKDALKKYGAFNVFLVTDYGEGIEPWIAEIICNVGAASNTVLVLCGGAATPLPIESGVNAVMYCPYCATVRAIQAMLTSVSPRGHLPFTWCKSEKSYPRNNKKFIERGDFRYESVFNGYALFNNFKSDVLYPFGHGLNYSFYDITKFAVSSNGMKITVDFIIKNTGNYAGIAVTQAYISLIGGSVYGLSKRLAAFKRIPLDKTENSHVVLEIDLDKFRVFDENNNALVPVGGKYKVELGLSSTDIRAAAEIKVAAGSRVDAGLGKALAPSYYDYGSEFEPTAPEIERLLKVPFIKKPDEYPELEKPAPSKIKSTLKRAEKTVMPRLLPIVRYKIENTPIK